MKNKEKFMKEIVALACNESSIAVEKATGKPIDCSIIKCNRCKFYSYENVTCCGGLKEWAESEYVERPVISKADRVLLECLKKDRKYLARDENGRLYSYIMKPSKDIDLRMWAGSSDVASMDGSFNADFPMVKWEDDRPWLVEDLLKLNVVDEYEAD